jgi:hypothetical protein
VQDRGGLEITNGIDETSAPFCGIIAARWAGISKHLHIDLLINDDEHVDK